MHVYPTHTRHDCLLDCVVSLEHDSVDLLLHLSESAITRIRTCNVGGISLHCNTHVQQAHGLLRDHVIVDLIVQGGRVVARGTDALIRLELAVVVLHAVGFELGGKSALSDSTFDLSHDINMGKSSDKVSPFEDLDLFVVLYHT